MENSDTAVKRKLFAKAFEEASGKTAIQAGQTLFEAGNQLGVFDEEKENLKEKFKNLGSKFGLQNLKQKEEKQNSDGLLQDISIGNVDENKKPENPLDIDLTLDNVGLTKNFNITDDFTLGANINQPFEGETEFGITGEGEIIPNVNLKLNLTNKNQSGLLNFDKRF